MKLFAVMVNTGHGYFGSTDTTDCVSPGNGYEIWAAETEDLLLKDIWEEQCQLADGNGQPDNHCDNDNEGECEEYCVCEVPEDDYSEWVQNETYFYFFPYNPSNIQHVICKGAEEYRDTSAIAEYHKQNRIKDLRNMFNRTNNELDDLDLRIATLSNSLASITKELEELEKE